MNALLAPRVKETSTTTGTGTLSLLGAVAGFQTFVAGFGTGNPCYYTIVHGTAWEVGIGTVTDLATDTLSRDTILSSSAGGSALNLGAGTKTVFCDVTREAVSIHGGYFFGLGVSRNASDLTNDIDCSVGECASDDATVAQRIIVAPAAMTKRLDAVWASGTNQGGRLASDALANGIWQCFAFKPGASPDDFFFSTSLNPTPPSGTKKRRLGALIREASANVTVFTNSGDAPGTLVAGRECIQNPFATSTKTTAAHGLGAIPFQVLSYLECLIAERGYSVGDRIYLNQIAAGSNGYEVSADATNVYILTSTSSSAIVDKTTPSSVVNLTVADWKIVAVPYKLNPAV